MPHRKTIKHCHEPGHLHEFTFSCFKRRPLLTNDDWRGRLAQHINLAGQGAQFDLVAFVYMPEHIHLLTYPRDPKPNFGKYLALRKQPFSREI
jgi:putative transposase